MARLGPGRRAGGASACARPGRRGRGRRCRCRSSPPPASRPRRRGTAAGAHGSGKGSAGLDGRERRRPPAGQQQQPPADRPVDAREPQIGPRGRAARAGRPSARRPRRRRGGSRPPRRSRRVHRRMGSPGSGGRSRIRTSERALRHLEAAGQAGAAEQAAAAAAVLGLGAGLRFHLGGLGRDAADLGADADDLGWSALKPSAKESGIEHHSLLAAIHFMPSAPLAWSLPNRAQASCGVIFFFEFEAAFALATRSLRAWSVCLDRRRTAAPCAKAGRAGQRGPTDDGERPPIGLERMPRDPISADRVAGDGCRIRPMRARASNPAMSVLMPFRHRNVASFEPQTARARFAACGVNEPQMSARSLRVSATRLGCGHRRPRRVDSRGRHATTPAWPPTTSPRPASSSRPTSPRARPCPSTGRRRTTCSTSCAGGRTIRCCCSTAGTASGGRDLRPTGRKSARPHRRERTRAADRRARTCITCSRP